MAPLPVLLAGADRGRGCLLGIQPCLNSADYATPAALEGKLDAYFAAAAAEELLNSRTVVVLPEHIGSWLVAANAPPAVYQAATAEEALAAVVKARWWKLPAAYLRAQGRDRLRDAVFRMAAPQTAELYQRIFGGLAARYGCTVVAGSAALPSPQVVDGRLTPGRGPLQNVSAVFTPRGKLHPQLVRKVYPIAAEQSFLAAGSLDELPVFTTPAGRLGVLICADSWRPEPYARLAAQGVDFVAVPSHLACAGCWTQPWLGYDGAPPPADVDPADVGRISEGEAWRKYALGGRLASSGAAVGVNVFVRGDLWDLGADGASLALGPAGGEEAPYAEAGAIVGVWL